MNSQKEKKRSTVTCLKCKDARLVPKLSNFEGEIGERLISVWCRGLVCIQCGFKTMTPVQMEKFRRLLRKAYHSNPDLKVNSRL